MGEGTKVPDRAGQDLRRDERRKPRCAPAFDPAKERVARKDVTKLKTENSTRSIPLDLLLIDLGLLDRANELQARGETRLFPDWLPYTAPSSRVQWDRPLTRDWQYRRKKMKLRRENISLYSARHCMGDRLDDAGVAQRTRDRLTGHVPAGAKGRYGRKRQIHSRPPYFIRWKHLQ